jgi:hypothetical protein
MAREQRNEARSISCLKDIKNSISKEAFRFSGFLQQVRQTHTPFFSFFSSGSPLYLGLAEIPILKKILYKQTLDPKKTWVLSLGFGSGRRPKPKTEINSRLD